MTRFIKYYLTPIVLLLLSFCTLYAQVTPPPYSAFKDRYELLEPFVSTGIIIDRSPYTISSSGSHFSPFAHDGTQQLNGTNLIFQNLHRILFHAAYDTSMMKFSPDDFDGIYDYALYNTNRTGFTTAQLVNTQPVNDVALGFFHLDFQAISMVAIDSGFIMLDTLADRYKLRLDGIALLDTFDLDTNGILIVDTTYYLDSVDVVQKAFAKHLVLNFSALNEVVYSTSTIPQLRLYLSDSLWITNVTGYDYEVDWGNGNGFVSFNPGDKFYDISYPSFGEKTIQLKIENPAPSDLYPYLITTSTFELAFLQMGLPDTSIILPAITTSCTFDTTAGFGEGVASIKYRTNGNNALYKPVVIIEGIEVAFPESVENDKAMRGGFGVLNWAGLSSGNVPGYLQLTLFPKLLDSLVETGHDIIIVDFKTNRAPIQKNANLIINLLQWVNVQLEENNSPHQTIVIGASMGGLISRYAIRKMELEGCCHNVRLHTTFSSPHRGANVPLGIQSFLFELAHGNTLQSSNAQAKKSYDFVLNSPAARQLLIYHRDATALSDRQQFQYELDSMGHPQYARNLAVTNGSQLGNSLSFNGITVPQGDTLISMHSKIWYPQDLSTGLIGTYYASLAQLWNASSGIEDSLGKWTLLRLAGMSISEQPTPGTQNMLRGGRSVDYNIDAYINHTALTMGWSAALLAINTTYVYGMSLAIPNPLCPVICPIITVAYLMSRDITNSLFENQMFTSWQNNQHANFHPGTGFYPKSYSINYPTLSLDNAPGDLNNFQSTVEKLSGGLVKAKYPASTFLPSVSSLDIDTNYLILDIRSNKDDLLRESKIPFEDYWANKSGSDPIISANQGHVTITTSNINWIMQKIEETHPKFLSQQSSPELDEYYNFGTPVSSVPDSIILAPDVFLPSVTIRSGGNLHVNKLDDITYQSSGLGTPDEFGSFTLKTAEAACTPPEVIVDANGAFYVGDTNYVNLGGGLQDNNKADVFFRAGSKLELLGDALLRINDNSRVVIEEGAELILHKEHNIHLDGKNAVLEIRGKLTLKSNALLKPSGNGYLRFAQPVNQSVASDFWEFENGATIELNGSGKDDKKAEITGKLALDSTLNFFKVLNCRVDIHPGMEMHIKGRATIENARITKPQGATSRYGSVVVYGQPNLIVKNAEFLHGNYGLLALLPSAAHPLKVENSDFKHCINGLRINGKNLELKTSRLDSNTVGLKIDAATASCDIRNSQFNRNSSMGIEFSGQSTAALYFHESQSKYNGTGIQASGNCPVRLTCSSISNNTIGLDAYTVEVLLGGEARNDFTANQIGISISDVKHLILHDGYNNFATSTTYLYGAFADNPNLIYDDTNYKLNVQNNRLPAQHGLVAVDLLTYSAAPVMLHNWQPLSAFATLCPLAALASLDSVMLGNATTTLPVETSYQNGKLPLVVATAISDMTDDLAGVANRDEEAVAKLGEIFSFVRNHYTYRSGVQYLEYELSEDEVELMRFAINKALKALGNAYRHELLEPNRAVNETEVSEQLQTVQDELDNQLYYYNQDYDEERWFYNKLAKAQAYRSGEHYDYALEQLAGISTEDGKLEGIRDYWSCICEAEAEFILEITDATQYLEALDECVLNAPELRRRSPGPGIPVELLGETSSQINYTLYPNPSNGLITVSATSSLKGNAYRISDMQGTVHLSGSITSETSNYSFDASILSNGIYFIQLINDGSPPKTLKFVLVH